MSFDYGFAISRGQQRTARDNREQEANNAAEEGGNREPEGASGHLSKLQHPMTLFQRWSPEG